MRALLIGDIHTDAETLATALALGVDRRAPVGDRARPELRDCSRRSSLATFVA
jgi:hypothetical protein